MLTESDKIYNRIASTLGCGAFAVMTLYIAITTIMQATGTGSNLFKSFLFMAIGVAVLAAVSLVFAIKQLVRRSQIEPVIATGFAILAILETAAYWLIMHFSGSF